MLSKSLWLTALLCFSLVKTIASIPLDKKPWVGELNSNSQCMTYASEADKAAHARGLRDFMDTNQATLAERDIDQVDNNHFVFNVAFHVIYQNESITGGYINDSRIETQMKVLNDDYKQANISFTLVNVTRTFNLDWFNGSYPGSAQEQQMKRALKVGDSTTLNVYTLTFNSSTSSLGISSIPSKYHSDPMSDGILIRHSTISGGTKKNFDIGRTLTHEVGHWLGLFHTFEGGCDDGVGDNVDDTPPQASGSEGCPTGRDSCPGNGPDLINNFMDYSYDACMNSFTKGQIARMHQSIQAFRQPATQSAPGITK